MTKINEKKLLEMRNNIISTPGLIFDQMIHSLILNNQVAYDIAVVKLNGVYNYTPIDILARNEYFFNTGSNKENIDKHFAKFPLKLGNPRQNATLLNMAIKHGANDFVDYLLSVGVDPNIRDLSKAFPITTGVLYNNTQVVKSLIKYKADVNLPWRQKFSTLGLALSLESHDMINELKNAGAINNNVFYNCKPLQEKVAYPKDSIQYKSLLLKTYSFQAIFSESNQDIFFRTTYSCFERIDLKSLNNLQDQKKLEIATDIISVAHAILSIYQFSSEIKTSLVNKIMAIAEEYSLQNHIRCVYTTLGTDAFHLDSIQAIEYLQKAYDIAFNAKPGAAEGSVLNKGVASYNLARAMRAFNPKYALTLFEQAEEYLPDDQEVIDGKIRLLLALRDARGIDLVPKCSNQEEMLKIGILTNSIEDIVPISRNDILSRLVKNEIEETTNNTASPTYNSENKSSILSRLIENEIEETTNNNTASPIYNSENKLDFLSLIIKARTSKIIDDAEVRQLFRDYANDNTKDITEMTDMLSQFLQGVYHSLGLHEQGLKFIEFIEEQYQHVFQNHKYIPLQYAEFIIYEANGLYAKSDKILENFKKVYGTSDNIHYQYSLMLKSRAKNILFDQGKEKAQEFIDTIEDQHLKQEVSKNVFSVKLTEDKTSLELTSELVSSILETSVSAPTDVKIDASNLAADENILNPSKETEPLPTFTTILPVDKVSADLQDNPKIATIEAEAITDDALSVTDIAYSDPKEIHEYHSRKKALPPIDSTLPAKYCSSWVIGNKYYYTYQEDVVALGLNIYGCIDNKIYNRLSKKLQTQFTQGLKKGIIVGTSVGKAGVICNKNDTTVKIKINGDDRLYTNKVYINEESKKLYIFDRRGDHKELERATKFGEIFTEHVKGYTSFHEQDSATDTVSHYESVDIAGSNMDLITE